MQGIPRQVLSNIITCTRKRRYTEQEAKDKAVSLGKEGIIVRHYLCSRCLKWHIGRKGGRK